MSSSALEAAERDRCRGFNMSAARLPGGEDLLLGVERLAVTIGIGRRAATRRERQIVGEAGSSLPVDAE